MILAELVPILHPAKSESNTLVVLLFWLVSNWFNCRYLCCYIYLKSLDVCRDRTLFVHVPPVNTPYTSAETAKALLAIAEKSLKQLDDQGKLW